MFTEFKKTLWVVYRDFWDNGFTSAFNKFLDLIDPSGERKALKVSSFSLVGIFLFYYENKVDCKQELSSYLFFKVYLIEN